MVEVGKYNTLGIIREVDFGVYLDGKNLGDILLPTRYIPEGAQIFEDIEVFLYYDSEDRLIATTEKPLVCVGEFAALEVVQTAKFGAFLNWGLPKDLLLPFSEQKQKVNAGEKVVVHVHVDDESDRIVASARVERYLNKLVPNFEAGQEVDMLIYEVTELGYKAILDGTHTGLLYKNEVFEILNVGDQRKGYIKKMRDDGKLDVNLYKPGYEKVDDSSEKILSYLQSTGGEMFITDKSEASEINDVFGMSKKTFKKAIGNLYRQKLIQLHPDRIELTKA